MTSKRVKIIVAIGALAAVPTTLLVRRVADAHRSAVRPSQTVTANTVGSSVASDAGVVSPGVPTVATVPEITAAVPGFDPASMRREGGRYVVPLSNGRKAMLTVEPAWQRGISAVIERYQVPRAAVILLDTDTGRVRAYVTHGIDGHGDLGRDATPPAASVFKIVTSGALIAHGLTDTTTTCFWGGFHSINERELTIDPRHDRDCASLANAFGRSANTVFARRAVELLNAQQLLDSAHGWGFGETIPFDGDVPAAALDVPSERLEFARTAAGFWHSHMSPIHAAAIAQGIARGGELQRPFMIDGIFDEHGVRLATGGPHVWKRAVTPEIAATLAKMMLNSVSEGTAYHAFHDDAGRSFLPDVVVGGKTGTLTAAQPYRAYTWFVGNAVGANASPRISFAVMVANDPVWRIKASTLARQALQIVYRGRATD